MPKTEPQKTEPQTIESQIIAAYRKRAVSFARKSQHLSRISQYVSHARLAAFLGILAALLWTEWVGGSQGAYLIAGVMALAFVGLVVWHGNLRDRQRWFQELERLNSESVHRIQRVWRELPPSRIPAPDPDHAYAADLDIFGSASLLQLLGDPGTAAGRWELEQWLLEPASVAGITQRQQAVAELSEMLDLRQQILARARVGAELRVDDLDGFVDWLRSEPWLASRRNLSRLVRLLPLATGTMIFLNVLGIVGFQAWATLVLIQAVLARVYQGQLHQQFRRASPREAVFRGYPAIFQQLSRTRFDSPLLGELQRTLLAGPEPAHKGIKHLDRLSHLANLRFSQMAHVPLQAFTLWDFHVLAGLERWRHQYGSQAPEWFAGLGRFEALSALAGLAHDNPDWAFPEIVPEGPAVYHGGSLAHPLLSRSVRVANDVELGPPGSFLLVTGSNMSGKSTLLRAIGLNAVLAQAGGPVCASQLRMPPVDVVTSMRVQDSLEGGVSYFMAALIRLKAVIDSVHGAAASDRIPLYLLDEMLQGTNTAERRVAVRAIIDHLLGARAIGAVTTHDLSLAEIPELQRAAQAVHFSESVTVEGDEGGTMRFDYELRPGLATSVNALRLMRLVGLPVDATRHPGQGGRSDGNNHH